jgi:hypothetical protein
VSTSLRERAECRDGDCEWSVEGSPWEVNPKAVRHAREEGHAIGISSLDEKADQSDQTVVPDGGIDGACPECGSEAYDREDDVVRCPDCGFESGPLTDGGRERECPECEKLLVYRGECAGCDWEADEAELATDGGHDRDRYIQEKDPETRLREAINQISIVREEISDVHGHPHEDDPALAEAEIRIRGVADKLEEADLEHRADEDDLITDGGSKLITDGGSKYVNETGEGYQGISVVSHRSCRFAIGSIRAVNWSVGETVFAIGVADRAVALTKDPSPDHLCECRIVDTSEGIKISLGREIMDYLGIPDGGDIRIYDREPGGLYAAPAADDPFVEQDASEIEEISTDSKQEKQAEDSATGYFGGAESKTSRSLRIAIGAKYGRDLRERVDSIGNTAAAVRFRRPLLEEIGEDVLDEGDNVGDLGVEEIRARIAEALGREEPAGHFNWLHLRDLYEAVVDPEDVTDPEHLDIEDAPGDGQGGTSRTTAGPGDDSGQVINWGRKR